MSDAMDDGTGKAISRARNLVVFRDIAELRDVWQDLRRSHYAAQQNGCRLESFPIWTLRQLSHGTIPLMLEAEYGFRARAIDFYGPLLSRHYGHPSWYFVLFFGSLSQPSIRALLRIRRERPNLSFESLYLEVKQSRSSRHAFRPTDESITKFIDFEACCSLTFILLNCKKTNIR